MTHTTQLLYNTRNRLPRAHCNAPLDTQTIALFCTRIDNWGDIGVTWRLARALAARGRGVIWWVDDLAAARTYTAHAPLPASVELRHWTRDAPTPEDRVVLATVAAVVEAFACGFSPAWLETFAAISPPPTWIVLEHLVTEPWAAEVHGLSSPHPRLPLTARWCVPGFEPHSGGLLREEPLPPPFARSCARTQPCDTLPSSAASPLTPSSPPLWPHSLPLPLDRYRHISLFCYPDAPLGGFLTALAADPTPTLIWVPPEASRAALAAHGIALTDTPLPWPETPHRFEPIPFLPPDAYDQLLAFCTLNWVRGEDSFLRAQWAARPFVWSPYRRPDGAHATFAAAFRARFRGDWPLADTEPAIADPATWQRAFATLPAWEAHCWRWRQTLLALPSLVDALLGLIPSNMR